MSYNFIEHNDTFSKKASMAILTIREIVQIYGIYSLFKKFTGQHIKKMMTFCCQATPTFIKNQT